MREDPEVKYILQHVGLGDDAADVVRQLLDNDVINHTTARGIMIAYEYQRLSKELETKAAALHEVAAAANVTVSCVKKNLRRFRR